MNATTIQKQRLGRILSILAALALVSTLVVRTSQAAFTATTTNAGNSFSAGDVVLTDNDAGDTLVLFTVPPTMAPGDTIVECITVTYNGTITTPLPVKLYSNGLGAVAPNATSAPGPGGGPLENVLTVTVDEGTGGTFGNCTGFTADGGAGNIVPTETLAAFLGRTAYGAAAAGTWTPTATGQFKSYRFTVTLPGTTGNTYQASALSNVAFIWEIQSN